MRRYRIICLLSCFVVVCTSLSAQYWNPDWTRRLRRRIQPVNLAALYPGPCVEYDQYVSVYFDDFNGDSLDHWFWRPDMLNFHHSPTGVFTDEYNSEEQISVDNTNNGTLIFSIVDDPIFAKGVDFLPDTAFFKNIGTNLRTWRFRSGAITSNWDLHYGRYSLRAQVPSGQWMWPAFWLYGTCGSEIDIFEFQEESNNHQHDRKPSFSTHEAWEQCDGKSHGSTRTVNVGQNLTTSFHVYSLTWDDFVIRFWIDGQVITTFYHYYQIQFGNTLVGIENCQSIPLLGTFRQDPIYPDVMMKVIANAAVMKDASAGDLPREMKLDYFNVQERMDCQGTTVVVDTMDFPGFGGRADWGDRTLTDGFILIDPLDSLILRGVPMNEPWLEGDFAILTSATEIVFKPNFGVEFGANLIAQIRPCQSSSKTDGEDGLQTQPPFMIELPDEDQFTDSTRFDSYQALEKARLNPILLPNPAIDYCRVEGLKCGDEVQLIDMLGRNRLGAILVTESFLNLNIESLPSGTYWVRISRDAVLVTVLKLVKIRG